MPLDYNQLKGLPSIGDYRQAQAEFEMKKLAALQDQELGKVQIQTLQKALNSDPSALSQKEKWDIILRQQELRQKGMDGGLTTNPNIGVGGYVADMGQFNQGGVSSDLINSVMRVESAGNPNAVSSAGAQGLMQIMPDTARDPGYGVRPLQGWDGKNPMTAPAEEQIRFGKDYLAAMIEQNGGNQDLGLAAYNAGQGSVEKYGGIPPFQETQDYVKKVNQNLGNQPPQVDAKPLYQNGKPFTTGLNAGYQWAQDSQGNRVAIKVPGTPSTKEELEVKKQLGAKDNLDNTLLEIQNLYDELAQEGQIRTNTQGTLANVADYYRNNPYMGGKQLGDLYNTPSSSIRERIDAAKSRAAALYIDAAGLSSGQTNSLAEQQRFLDALGGYDKGYEANQQILEGLSRTYGKSAVKRRSLNKDSSQGTAIDYREYFNANN